MSKLVRMGDLFEDTVKEQMGEHRTLAAADNLAGKIFFPDLDGQDNYYIHRQPTHTPEIPYLPEWVTVLGEYESNLLGKLLRPTSAVICIVGDMGSGKTTTIRYLTKILRDKACGQCMANGSKNHDILIAHIDFRKRPVEINEPDLDGKTLIQEICYELKARSSSVIDEIEELYDFWKQIIDLYDHSEDPEVDETARVLLAEASWLRQQDEAHATKRQRKDLLGKLETRDKDWYLRYLVLLWRYLLKTRYNGHRERTLVVLDNVDTLPPILQRRLVDFMLKTSSKDGPTFVILMRPETLMRQGLADTLVDVVIHEGPKPIDVVLDRLQRFCAAPSKFIEPELGLTTEQNRLMTEFLQYMHQQMVSEGDEVFVSFLSSAAGKSVRLALVLAQGLVMVRVSDMKKKTLTSHFLIRACITNGKPQFKAGPRHPIENLFNVAGMEEGRLLVKPRILKYLSDQGGKGSVSNIRSSFMCFGYDDELIKKALNDMLRFECQMMRADGHDIFRNNWGGEQETVYLTEIGKGYLNHLIYSTDFVQEVMLDSFVEGANWPRTVESDSLYDKLHLLYLFLRDLFHADSREVAGLVHRQGAAYYHGLFGTRLLVVDLVQNIYESVWRISCSVVSRYPHQQVKYEGLVDNFTSLTRLVEKKSEDLLGLAPIPAVEHALLNC